MARLLLPILAPGACQVGLVFDHHHRQHHPDHLHRHFHHNWTILNISVCLPSWPSFDQIYPFLHAVPRQGDHYRHHNQHELFLRCIANYIWSPTPSPCCGCQRCCFSSFIFHFFSDAAEGNIVVMQSSLGCWPPSSWRARWLPSSPYCGHQRCCLSLSIPLFSPHLFPMPKPSCHWIFNRLSPALPPLSLVFLYMVSTPYNRLHMDNNKVAAIPSSWLAQPFNTEVRRPPEQLLLQSGQ